MNTQSKSLNFGNGLKFWLQLGGGFVVRIFLCLRIKSLTGIKWPPSCFEPRYESEALYIAFVLKISFHSYANKTNFHMKALHEASLS